MMYSFSSTSQMKVRSSAGKQQQQQQQQQQPVRIEAVMTGRTCSSRGHDDLQLLLHDDFLLCPETAQHLEDTA
jgi:hypothetical protein